jgi:hypothetical protein
VDHLPALKTIEMSWIMTDPSGVFPQWEAEAHAAFSLLIWRGILRITKLQCMCTEFLTIDQAFTHRCFLVGQGSLYPLGWE